MPTKDPDESEIFNPARNGGGQRVPMERPAVSPTRDLTGRDPDGPKTAKFNPDDMSDEEMASAPASPPRGTKDATLRRFLDS